MRDVLADVIARWRHGEMCAVATAGARAVRRLGRRRLRGGSDPRADHAVTDDSLGLLVFGAIDFSAAVSRIGVFLGYQVTVCDARPVFATRERFPDADDVVVDWPHRYLAVEYERGPVDSRAVATVLTHDTKFDVPLLATALRIPEIAYVGAM